MGHRSPRASSVLSWMHLLRVTVMGPVALCCFCACHVCGLPVGSLRSILLAGAIALLASGGLVLNDVVDCRKDRVNRPSRPLPSGRIATGAAGRAAAIMLTASVTGLLCTGSAHVAIEGAVALLLVTCYGSISRRLGWCKNLATGVLATLPWIAPATLAGDWGPVRVPMLCTLLLVVSREVLLDLDDMAGDRLVGIRTLPLTAGPGLSRAFSLLLMAVSTGMMVRFGYARATHGWYLPVVWLGVALPAVVVAFALVLDAPRPWMRVAQNLGKVQFISGAVAWLATRTG